MAFLFEEDTKVAARNTFFLGVLFSTFLIIGSLFLYTDTHPLHLSEVDSLAAVAPAALLGRTNTDRIIYGVPLLLENPLLSKAAQMKADDMLLRGYYSHTTPEGYSPLHFLDMVGYKYLNVGENLDLTYIETEEDVETAWMNSPEHRANLLFPAFTEVGVAVAEGVYQGEHVTFAVEIYATPLPVSPPQLPKISEVIPTEQVLVPTKPSVVTVVPRVVSLKKPTLESILPSLPTSTPPEVVMSESNATVSPLLTFRGVSSTTSPKTSVLSHFIQKMVSRILHVFFK